MLIFESIAIVVCYKGSLIPFLYQLVSRLVTKKDVLSLTILLMLVPS